jgi:hypothetical protein
MANVLFLKGRCPVSMLHIRSTPVDLHRYMPINPFLLFDPHPKGGTCLTFKKNQANNHPTWFINGRNLAVTLSIFIVAF